MGSASRLLGSRIVQASPEYSFCAGCNSCEVVCSLTHDGLVGPCYNRLFVEKDARRMYHIIHTCQHCLDHPCYDACPKKGEAMAIDDDGIVYIIEENCIGCGLCRKACVFEPPRLNIVSSVDKSLRKAKKCDMCRLRENGPACVEWCPVRCISVVRGEVSL